MACNIEEKLFLDENLYKELVSGHEDLFIEGLTFAEQREVVSYMANKIYRENMRARKEGGSYTSAELASELIKTIKAEIKKNEETISSAKLFDPEDNAEFIAGLEYNNQTLKAVLYNQTKFITLSKKFLKTVQGIDIVTEEDVAFDEAGNIVERDLSDEFTDESQVNMERTDFSDNYSLEMNSKERIGGHLKSFLSFIKKSRFGRNKTPESAKTFFGTEDFMDFNVVYDELHRLLEGVYPSYEYILSKLQEKYEEAKNTNNHNLAWLGDLIEQLSKDENGKYNIDETTRFMFVRDVTKHKVEMEFVYQYMLQDKNGDYHAILTVKNDNESTLSSRLQKEWAAAHVKSPVVNKNGEYDKDKLFKSLSRIDTAISNDDTEALKTAVRLALADIGIEIPELLLEALGEGKVNVVTPSAKYGSLKKVAIAIQTEINTFSQKVDPNKLRSSFFKGLAFVSAKFMPDEFSNVFRVADKLIYTYTANHHLYTKMRDLKVNKNNIRENLGKAVFNGLSFYLQELDNADFNQWFDMRYVSLSPVMRKMSNGKYNRSEGATKLSDMDFETMVLGYALRNYDNANKTITVGNDTTGLSASKGTFVSPTFSDKSRAMLMNGYFINAATEVDGELVLDNKAIELFYETIVKGEIERIVRSTDPEYVEKLDLATYNGGAFYLTPKLNNLFVKISPEGKPYFSWAEKEGYISLPNLIKNSKGDQKILDSIAPTIKAILKQDLEAKALDRLAEWGELGLLDGDNLKFKDRDLTSKAFVGENGEPYVAPALEVAMSLVFSEEFNAANFFQLIAGDPAQYYKGDVSGTYGNITKRLAAEIAPGDEADYHDMPKYRQVYLQDRITFSENIGQIMELLDDISPAEGEAMVKEYYNKLQSAVTQEEKAEVAKLKEELRSLNSWAYINIPSTDAQEYVTWRTHLSEMLRYGELTKDEHDQAYDLLSKGEDLPKSLFKKVLGPRKPVYSNTEIVNVDPEGNETFFKKTYIKSSSFPLLPQLVRNLELSKLAAAMEKLEKVEGSNKRINVRAAYSSAVKVGFPKTGAKIFNQDGTIPDNLDLSSNFKELESSGFRIQQSVPYKQDKDSILKGSQESKLLFANLLDIEFTDLDGTKKSGIELEQEYLGAYHELYKLGLNDLKEFITVEKKNEDGDITREIDYRKLSRLLIKELESRKEFGIAIKNGLKIDHNTGTFKIPLWESDYADQYMALINSIVKKFVLKHELPGTSSVLGSDAGFKGIITLGELKTGTEDIVYTKSYDKTKGLLPQRLSEDGETILPAQILLPFKFRDNEGNLLNAKDFVDEETGLIDISKLPDEVRESFVFRIPTQLQQSMAFIEVVGFLPEKLGDLVIAPKDFVAQMGSDFDVDKLYQYMYNTVYNADTNSLTKLEYTSPEDYQLQLDSIDNEIEALQSNYNEKVRDIVKNEIRLRIKEKKKELKSSKKSTELKKQLIKEMVDEEFSKYKEYEKELAEVSGLKDINTELQDLYLKREKLTENFKKGLQNRILDVHKVVMLNKEAQKRIIKPLSAGKFEDIAKKVDKYRQANKEIDSIISYKYNRKKLKDGASGKDGISIFSSDSIINALAQGKGLVVGDYALDREGELRWFPIFTRYKREIIGKDSNGNPIYNYLPEEGVKFGKNYAASYGHIGLTHGLKLGQNKQEYDISPTDYIVGLQNISVDNANMEVMAKINVNETTAGVYALLSMLGFDENITAYFMSQPILFDYVTEKGNKEGVLADYDPNKELTIWNKLREKYDTDPENKYNPEDHDVLADFVDQDATEIMRSMIELGDKYGPDFGRTQLAVLSKFLALAQIARDKIAPLKQLLNLDSKGMNKNFAVTKSRMDTANNLPNSPVKNAHKLLGEYTQLPDKSWLFTKPTTLAGFDNFYGARNLLFMFGQNFIETAGWADFDGIVSKVSEAMGRDDNKLSDTQMYHVRNHIMHFMHSNLKIGDVKTLRNLLFKNTNTGSLYDSLVKLKNTDYGKNNKFIRSLDIGLEDGIVSIDYNRVPGDAFDDNSIYMAFLDMMYTNINLSNGSNPAKVAQQLVYYSLLKGGRKGTSIKKFIPAEILRKVLGGTTTFNSNLFVKQYLQNNSNLVVTLKPENYKILDDGRVQLLSTKRPVAINVSETKDINGVQRRIVHLALLQNREKGVYATVPTYPGEDVTYYDPTADVDEVLDVHTDFGEYDEYAGSVIPDILEADKIDPIKDVATIYDTVKEEAVPKDISAVFYSFKEASKTNNIPVEITDTLPDNIHGQYKINARKMLLNRNTMENNGTDDTSFLRVILHEHAHGLTSNMLYDYFSGKEVPKDVATAIENITSKMGTEIDRIYNNKYERGRFQNYMRYLYYQMAMDGEATKGNNENPFSLVMKSIEHPWLHQIASEVLAMAKNGETFSQEEAKEIDASMKIINGMEKAEFYYALSNPYEFIAVAVSNTKLMDTYMSKTNIIGKVKELFSRVLRALGIQSDVVESLLEDIFTIAQIDLAGPESDQTTTINSKAIQYEDKVVAISQDGENFISTSGVTVATKFGTKEILYRELTEKFVAAHMDKALNWKWPLTKEKVTYDMIKKYVTDIKYGYKFNPLTGTIALSFLQNEVDNNKSKRSIRDSISLMESIKDNMGLTEFKVPSPKNDSTVDVGEGTTSDLTPVNTFAKDPKKNAYLEKASKFITKAPGVNVISKSLSENSEIGQMVDNLEFNSLKKLGEKLIEYCGGTSKSKSTWSKVNVANTVKAEKGLFIPGKNSFKDVNTTWSSIQANTNTLYAEHGAVIKRNNSIDSSSWEKVSGNLNYSNGVLKKNTNNFAGEWSLVTKLEGPSHAKGGIDLTISDEGIAIKRNGADLKAEKGMVVMSEPKNTEMVEVPVDEPKVIVKSSKKKYVKRK